MSFGELCLILRMSMLRGIWRDLEQAAQPCGSLPDDPVPSCRRRGPLFARPLSAATSLPYEL